MTREQAIKWLKDFLKNGDFSMPQYEQALEMAIQALKKENIYDDKEHYVTISKALYDKLNIDYEQALSQQPCDDAVSREWLMRKATERFYTTNYFNHISAMIEEAPSVTQKSGKWEDLHRCWACSECGQETHIEHNYCPHCGAKMESEDRTE